jgi:hypothetical protein
MTDRQRLVVQKGQVDTQWEMIGSPSSIPSSELANDFNTTTAAGTGTVNAAYGGAGNLGQKNEAGEAPWQQVSDPITQEQYVPGRMDQEAVRAYQDNWDDLT